jgi:uncharacterized protein (UPF0212 family)
MKSPSSSSLVTLQGVTMYEQHPGQLDLVEELSSLRLVACPDCGSTAEVEWQAAQYSTQGLVVLMKIRCLDRHWFLMPSDSLVTAS